VLREEDDRLAVAAYIMANPIRARLCEKPADYPYVGSDQYTVEQLSEAIQIVPQWKRRSRP